MTDRSGPERWARPTRRSALIFAAKAWGLRARRAVADAGAAAPRLVRSGYQSDQTVLAQSSTPLWSDETVSERVAQFGKVENLRVAARALDGLVIPTGAKFSFWRQLGPPTTWRGFARGRMLQEGCLVAAVGGGLCQLSNALYEIALQAGCEIAERHAHSQIVPGSSAALGRDATVAWNYVDLRFVASRDLRLSVRLTRNDLVVRFIADEGEGERAHQIEPPMMASPPPVAARSCATCDEIDCFRHNRESHATRSSDQRHVFLVDEAWPEFQRFVHESRTSTDRLGLPLDGERLRLARYAWAVDGFDRVGDAPIEALRRSHDLRRAGAQGAIRRQAEFNGSRRIAKALARLLTPEVTAVTVAQSYLPFLWRDSHLAGREVSVLMTSLPMAVLQSRLDVAARVHPDRPTLADFRAPTWVVEAEREALAQAAHIIAPHAEIARLFQDRAIQLEWRTPQADRSPTHRFSHRVAFPGPAVARKGAHVVRAVALALNLELLLMGAELEGSDFWRGVRTIRDVDWRTARVMIQPALVEDQPRRLLAALAAGIPVIATAACGLANHPGLTLVPPDDEAALTQALTAVLALEPIGEAAIP